jgi:hypothetical protein
VVLVLPYELRADGGEPLVDTPLRRARSGAERTDCCIDGAALPLDLVAQHDEVVQRVVVERKAELLAALRKRVTNGVHVVDVADLDEPVDRDDHVEEQRCVPRLLAPAAQARVVPGEQVDDLREDRRARLIVSAALLGERQRQHREDCPVSPRGVLVRHGRDGGEAGEGPQVRRTWRVLNQATRDGSEDRREHDRHRVLERP